MAQKKPFGRSLSDFGSLKPGEQKLLDACRVEDVAILDYSGVPVIASNNRVVRAEFLRFLLLGGDDNNPVHERGVKLHGAFVLGELDLSGCHIKVSFGLTFCRFNNRVNAAGAEFDGNINMVGCFLVKGIKADQLCCAKSVVLGNEFKSTAGLNFRGAKVLGDFYCGGAKIIVKDAKALSADGMSIGGNATFNDGFEATGEVSLLDALIGGSLNCEGGQFKVDAGDALSADRIKVKGSVFLDDGFKAIGGVRLLGAQIDNNLSCGRGDFEAFDGDAINANRVNIKGSVLLCDAFNAIGTINFSGAKIGGNFLCSDGNFKVGEGAALVLNRANINGSVFLRDDFQAIGAVNFYGATIGGNFECVGGKFNVTQGNALTLSRANINGSVLLSGGFSVAGKVLLLGAKIGGDLNCYRGKFETKNSTSLVLTGAFIRGIFQLGENPYPVRINASHAEIAVLVGKVECWAKGSILDGFCYGSFGGVTSSIGEERLRWLLNQSNTHLGRRDFRPQPWRQLQRVLRDMGHTEDAKLVGIKYEEHQRKIGSVGGSVKEVNFIFAWWRRVIARCLHYGFGLLAAYGYRPIRLLTWMLGVWLTCAVAYWYLALPENNAIAPSDPLVFQNNKYEECRPDYGDGPGNWYLCDKLRSEYATFSPLAYSLDLMLPVVDLGLEKTWGAYIPSPKQNWFEELFTHWHPGHVVRLITWFEILFGWVSSLLLVAIISGFSRRNDEG